ncbi:hypothetical protein [Paenibacillus tundrae]|nr:hypothetical protein [Paenibacillus tundrae]
MTTFLYHMWVRHHLRPGEFWSLSRGERSLLLAFSEEEMDAITKQNNR